MDTFGDDSTIYRIQTIVIYISLSEMFYETEACIMLAQYTSIYND